MTNHQENTPGLPLSLLFSEAMRTVLSPLTNGRASNLIRPTIATLYLTSFCNSRCNMCDFWKNDHDPKELDSMQWGIVLSRLRSFGVRYIGVNASGEMFTRSDVFDILQHIQDLKMSFGINTNGTLISKRKAEMLARLQPRVVTIGLDGIGAEHYLETRGLKHGFSKIVRNIAHMQDAGIKNIRIGSVMMPENINGWQELCDFVEEHHLQGIRFTAYHDNYFNADDDIKITRAPDPEFVAKVEREIENLIDRKKARGTVTNSTDYLKHATRFFQAGGNYFPVHCLQGSNRIELDVYGNVTLCSFVTESLGNLLEQEMEDIWQSDKHKKARRDAYNGDCPHCLLSCYAEESLRLSTKGFLPTLGETTRRASRMLLGH